MRMLGTKKEKVIDINFSFHRARPIDRGEMRCNYFTYRFLTAPQNLEHLRQLVFLTDGQSDISSDISVPLVLPKLHGS